MVLEGLLALGVIIGDDKKRGGVSLTVTNHPAADTEKGEPSDALPSLNSLERCITH
jgi:hypothetical protein